MILDRLDIDPEDFANRTGWEVKPQGACRAEVCVPLPDEVNMAGGRLAAPVLAERLGMPLLEAHDHGLWALGPASASGRALSDAQAPDLSLPDVHGQEFNLATLHGQKVLLVAWASW